MTGNDRVLAPDAEGAALESVRRSIAGDLVELMVLTADEAFLATLREALGPTRRLWHVGSAEQASDLLLGGQAAILVVDAAALAGSPAVFVTQIKRQFPDVVLLVAGHRDAEAALAGLVSGGTVYRFMHKPVSPARARLFSDAAIKKHQQQRQQSAPPPPSPPKARVPRTVWIGAAVAGAAAAAAAVWFAKGGENGSPAARTAVSDPKDAARAALLSRAAAALGANRLTEPADDNALTLYRAAQAQDPGDAEVRAGLAEVRERLLARAENALLEEHLDDAGAAIETARTSGIESGRLAFLTAQLGKAREEARATAARNAAAAAKTARPGIEGKTPSDSKALQDKVGALLALAADRVVASRLIDPAEDSALHYVREALTLDPDSTAAADAENALALRVLSEAHEAIDRRDFAHASAWLDAVQGIASAANVEAARHQLEAARRRADSDARVTLLRNARARLAEDRLIEPAGDSAKYYLSTLRDLAPDEPGLSAVTEELGARLIVKARRSLTLQQYDAARTWLDEAVALGYTGTDAAGARRELEAAAAAQLFAANVVSEGTLHRLKSVQPTYPVAAQLGKIEGWVELDFTVTEQGTVKDVAVHGGSPAGMFDGAARNALSQWRYQPATRDGKAVAQRARIRIRFTLRG